MSVVREVRLVQVNPGVNANRFYVVVLDASGTLTKRWGRVGAAGQTKVEPYATNYTFDRAVAAKEARGYKRVETIDTPTGAAPAVTGQAVLAKAAKKALVKDADPTLDALVERIAAANRHAITTASGGQITFTATGQATTALGPVSAAAVARARVLLDQIVAASPSGPARSALVADYLTLIPQKVGRRAGWDATFAASSVDQRKQYDLLDALATVTPVPVAPAADTPEVTFRYQVALADAATTAQVTAKFEAERNAAHGDVSRLRVKRVFVLTDTATGAVADQQTAVFKTRNVQTLWHGTRLHNLLNILRTGLAVAGTGTVRQESGAMFGAGIYLSKQASKSLRYSAGLWGGGGRESGSVFMFLADVAMGWELRPRTAADHRLLGTKDPATGKTYASISVAPGTCGVRNHEAIVKDPARVRLNYLVELA